MSDRMTEIQARADAYEKRYPWRLKEGAKDFLPRDRAYLLSELRAAQEENEKLRNLVAELYDGEPCQWDHNHSCQAHGFFYIPQGEKCPMGKAAELIRAALTDEGNN